MTEPWEDALDAVSVLVEPVRRSMYRFVRAQGRPVTREEVAEATGTSVKLAAFHLDKLAEHGWLRSRHAEASRPTTGGRPPKLYEPADRQVELTLPARRYDLMAEILLKAAGSEPDGAIGQARGAAFELGSSIAERFRAGRGVRATQAGHGVGATQAGHGVGATQAGHGVGATQAGRRLRRLGPERTLAAVVELLAEVGFEPRRTGPGEVILANCPFRSLAESDPGMVCQANQAMTEGLLAGLGGTGVEALLDRAADRCCVVLRRSDRPA